jgi:hypothetical protein
MNDPQPFGFFRNLWWRHKKPLLAAFLRQLSFSFWKRNQAWFRLRLLFTKNIFGVREAFGDRLRSSRVYIEVGKRIGISAAEAFILVLIFHYFSRFVGRVHFFTALKVNEAVAVQLVTTFAQVAATLLGLYFAAISTVISIAYARVPGDIRILIAEEQVSRVYFKILTLFAAVPILLSGFNAYGFQIDILNLVFVCLLGLFAVFSFITLGIRSFQFFDPTAILPFLQQKFVRVVIAATPAGYNWRNPAFQNYQQRQAEKLLGSCENLISLAASDERLSGQTLTDIGNALFQIGCYYSGQKSKISPTSQWFRRRNRHKEWLLTDYNEVSIALQTGSVLRPESVPDNDWIEDSIAKQLTRIIDELQRRNDTSSCMGIADKLHWYCRIAPNLGAFKEAVRMLQKLSPKLQAMSASAPDAKVDDFGIQSLAIADTSCASFVEVVLTSTRAFGRFDAPFLQKKVDQIRWDKPETVVIEGAPALLVAELKKLESQYYFELRVEGSVVSPAWWGVETSALAVVTEIRSFVISIAEQAESMFGQEAGNQLKSKRYLLVAQIVARGLEACSKCSHEFRELEALVGRLEKLNRSKDFTWPEIDWKNIQGRLQSLRKRLIAFLSRSSLLLEQFPSDDRLPDYFGQAYTIIADDCLIALFTGDKERFDELFGKYFALALKASQRLRARFLAKDAKNLWVSGDPVIDLLAISGYAMLATELDGVRFIDSAAQRWDVYLTGLGLKEEQQTIDLLGAFSERSAFRTPPRELIRIAWQQRWEGLLRGRGLTDSYDFLTPRVQHQSKLINYFAGSRGIERTQYLFLASHIYGRPNAKDLKPPSEVKQMQITLQRLRENEKSHLDE